MRIIADGTDRTQVKFDLSWEELQQSSFGSLGFCNKGQDRQNILWGLLGSVNCKPDWLKQDYGYDTSYNGLPYDKIVFDWAEGSWATWVSPTADEIKEMNLTAAEAEVFYSVLSTGSFQQTGEDVYFPELGLQFPNAERIARSCVYDPFVRVFRGGLESNETNSNDMDQHRRQSFRSNKDVMLRVANSGDKRALVHICARKNYFDEKQIVDDAPDLGLGDNLPIIAGWVQMVRLNQVMRGDRKYWAPDWKSL